MPQFRLFVKEFQKKEEGALLSAGYRECAPAEWANTTALSWEQVGRRLDHIRARRALPR